MVNNLGLQDRLNEVFGAYIFSVEKTSNKILVKHNESGKVLDFVTNNQRTILQLCGLVIKG